MPKTEQRDWKILALKIGVMWSEAKEPWQPPGAGTDSPHEPPEGAGPG